MVHMWSEYQHGVALLMLSMSSTTVGRMSGIDPIFLQLTYGIAVRFFSQRNEPDPPHRFVLALLPCFATCPREVYSFLFRIVSCWLVRSSTSFASVFLLTFAVVLCAMATQVMEAVATARIRFLAAQSPAARSGSRRRSAEGDASYLSPHHKLSSLCFTLLQRDWGGGDLK